MQEFSRWWFESLLPVLNSFDSESIETFLYCIPTDRAQRTGRFLDTGEAQLAQGMPFLTDVVRDMLDLIILRQTDWTFCKVH